MDSRFVLDLALRFAAGGSLVVLATLLARTRFPQLAGLAVLFPAVTLVAFYFLVANLGAEHVRPIIAFSVYALPAVLAFLLTLFWALHRYPTLPSFGLALGAWLSVAILLLALDAHLGLFARWR